MGHVASLNSGFNFDFTIKELASVSNLPASGASAKIEFRIISNVAAPGVYSGGIMIAPILALPSARLDGSPRVEGDCVLAYGSVGNTTVNINKYFKIRVISIFQFQSGAWVRVPAYVSNHGAAYTKVNLQMYYLGEEFAGLTGGWVVWNADANAVSVKNADNILVSAPAAHYASAYCATPIDLTDISTLYFSSKFVVTRSSACVAGVTTAITSVTKGYSERAAGVALTTNSGVVVETALDVSALSGLHYICVWGVDNSNTRGSNVYGARAE